VQALCVCDIGDGTALYVGGSFTTAGGLPANAIARWNGSSWSVLANGLGGGGVRALAAFDDGSGVALYAAGSFQSAGQGSASRIAKWNGTSWSALGSGMGGGDVDALAVFDDGSGSALYASGTFANAGGAAVQHIARWNGSGWSALAGGWSGGDPASIEALAVFDDGSGPALHAAGTLQVPASPPTSFVARWTGSSWTLLTSPSDSGESVLALAVGDLGGGPALYAGGDFLSVAGVPANAIARWDGTAWSALGSGMDYLFEPPVRTLSIYDDGSGPALYAGGRFSSAGSTSASNVARWDGTLWEALGSGVDDRVYALAPRVQSGAHALFAGGTFANAGGNPSNSLAEWGLRPGCPQPGSVVCEPGASGTAACPCSNPPSGPVRGCDNSAATGGAQLVQGGLSTLSNDTLVFTATGEPPVTLSMLLQGTQLVQAGLTFGQGVRCTSGVLTRLFYRNASGGMVSLPGSGDPSVSSRSAALGDPIAQGTHRYYGIYYRDPTVLGGCPAMSTLNITQQIDVLWHL
jgi:hypothetical protein